MMKQTIIKIDKANNVNSYISDDQFIIDIELDLDNMNDCLQVLYKEYPFVTSGQSMYNLYRVNFDFYIDKGKSVNMKAYYNPLLSVDLLHAITDVLNKHV